MSPALGEIKQLSNLLARQAGNHDWPAMLETAQKRQRALEDYFSQVELSDTQDIIRNTLTDIQQADKSLAELATQHRQLLLNDAIDLRQKWQTSNSYQSVQNLQT